MTDRAAARPLPTCDVRRVPAGRAVPQTGPRFLGASGTGAGRQYGGACAVERKADVQLGDQIELRRRLGHRVRGAVPATTDRPGSRSGTWLSSFLVAGKPLRRFLRRAIRAPRRSPRARQAAGLPRVSKPAPSAREPTLCAMHRPRNGPLGVAYPAQPLGAARPSQKPFRRTGYGQGSQARSGLRFLRARRPIRPDRAERPKALPRGSRPAAWTVQAAEKAGSARTPLWFRPSLPAGKTLLSRARPIRRRAKARATLRSRWMGPRGLAFRATHR